MKKFLSIFCAAAALTAFALTSCSDDEKDPSKISVDADFVQYSDIRDMALIYQGGEHRSITWSEDNFEPYVTHKFTDGTEDWIFDGYLFLEIYDGHKVQFAPGYGRPNALKSDWTTYMDRLFGKGHPIDNLNNVIERKKQTLGDFGGKHKVVLTCFVAIQGEKEWGEVNGKKLDFDVMEDRVAASKWLIDELIDRFNKQNPNNLELAGIYWLAESNNEQTNVTTHVRDYVHSKGLDFLWIPYWGARDAANWRDMGFDYAYQQPGHYFNFNTPDSRFDDVIPFALENNMLLEFECDEASLSTTAECKASRMETYMKYYEKTGVFDHCQLAYYTGDCLFYAATQLANPTETDKKLIDRLCRHIVNRRINGLGKHKDRN